MRKSFPRLPLHSTPTLAVAGSQPRPRNYLIQNQLPVCKIVGGVASPMLANLYFRRFILAWKQFGHERKLHARVVNYADDLVICCRPGKGQQAMEVFRSLMTRLGLTVNQRKTRLAKLPEGIV